MSATTKPRIAVVGSNMVDLVTYVKRMPVKGETVEGAKLRDGIRRQGRQAVAAAKLGASVVMVTAVGDDLFADNTIKNLAGLGIDTTYVRRVAGKSSGVATIMVEPSGENSILIVKGANADLSPADVERAAEVLKTCDLILLQFEVPLETVYAAIAFGKRHSIRTVLNPAPATPELDPERVRDVSFFLPN
jgi:ribokinase